LRTVALVRRVLELQSHKFQHGNDRIVIRNVMLTLPLADCAG
jgi:hypothetical protein